MYLKSLRVTNYRAHKDTSIDFDRHLTLIGGPNESGKSTLVEAAHRVLFLKSRTSGEYQKSMVSLHTAEPPEVELSFCKDNNTYTIQKRFAGTRGTALLTSNNGLNLRNEEAEEKLAELLGLQVGRYTPENWSHLWVWQGTSTSNLLHEDLAYRADLLQKLQRLGAAGLIQSEIDHRLKNKILESFESIFNKNESFKASSEVFRAEKTRNACQEQWDTKRIRFQELKQAADQYDAADRQLQDISSQITKQQQVMEKARIDYNTATATKQKLADLEHSLKEHQQKLDTFETAQKNFDRLQKELKTAEHKLSELKIAHVIALQSQKDLQQKIATASHQEIALSKLLRASRLQTNIAQATLQLADQKKELQRLEKLREQISHCENDRLELKRQLATMPNLTKKHLQELEQLDKDIFEAEISLKAMAASVKLLRGKLPVTLNGHPVIEDFDYPISSTTELVIDDSTHILITPGDGTSLADAQHNLNLFKQHRFEKLDQLKVQSYEEAQKFFAEQTEINQKIKTIDAKIEDLEATQVVKQLMETQTRVERLNLEKDRDTTTLESFLSTENISLPELLPQETWQAKYNTLEEQHQELAILLNQQRTNLENGRERIHLLEIEIKDYERSIEIYHEKIEYEARKLGDPDKRESMVIELKQIVDTKQSYRQKLQASLDELKPELLERLITRHESSLNKLHQEKENAIAIRAGANAKLRSDGSVDIYAELASAESAYQFAQNQFELHQREALGIKLLKELFDSEQQKLSDALTEPFVQRMKKYVQCFTGEIAKISFEVTNKGFDQLRIARPSDSNMPIDFEHLSGGAKEQIAAAARLAIAEVLASDSADGLPILFDDAFSYTDSRRLDGLPLMIEHAIHAGLQIIIVTCNPLQYAALGASIVQLNRQ